MAPTICSDKNTQLRSGITDIRKQSGTSSLSTSSPSSSSNYAQKRSKLVRPYPARGKRPIDSSIFQISSSSDTSNDTNERFRSYLPSQSPPPSNISDNSISTSSESSLLSPLSLSSFPSTFVSDDDYTPCTERLKPFYHSVDLSSVHSISSSDDEKNLDEFMISRSFSATASDSQDKVTSTIDDDKANLRSLSKLQMQQESKYTKGLFEIAIKMIRLVHRNQLLQRRLSQLQTETYQFIQSVLANPENQAFRDKVQTNSCCKNEMT